MQEVQLELVFEVIFLDFDFLWFETTDLIVTYFKSYKVFHSLLHFVAFGLLSQVLKFSQVVINICLLFIRLLKTVDISQQV